MRAGVNLQHARVGVLCIARREWARLARIDGGVASLVQRATVVSELTVGEGRSECVDAGTGLCTFVELVLDAQVR